ncbi:MAG: hypothetical protein Q9181_003581 [Wetmoreana brouardii]
MATTITPRTVETLKLDQFQRQFFHWYFINHRTLGETTRAFDFLFSQVAKIVGLEIQVNETQWRGRLEDWNRTWKIRKGRPGEEVKIPEYMEAMNLYYNGDHSLHKAFVCRFQPCNSCLSGAKHKQGHEQSILPNDEYLHHQNSPHEPTITTASTPSGTAQPFASAQITGPYLPTPSYPDPWNANNAHGGVFDNTQFASANQSPVYSGCTTPLPLLETSTSKAGALTHTPSGYDIEQFIQPPAAILSSALSRKRSRKSSPEPDAVAQVSVDNNESGINWLNGFGGGQYSAS